MVDGILIERYRDGRIDNKNNNSETYRRRILGLARLHLLKGLRNPQEWRLKALNVKGSSCTLLVKIIGVVSQGSEL